MAADSLGPLFSFLAPIIAYGYFGVFLLSLLGSLLPFVPTPYFIPVALLSLDPEFDPNTIVVFSAFGSALGKTILLRVTYSGRRFLSAKSRARMWPFEKLVSRYGWLAAFLAAATPIPDDLIFIPLGLAKYSIWKFLPVVFTGKIVITAIVAWGARLLGLPTVSFLLENVLNPFVVVAGVAVLLALVAVFIYIVTRVDWEAVVTRWFPWILKE